MKEGYAGEGVAELRYGKTGSDAHTIELVVPHGTKFKDVARLRELVFNDLIAKLPRGCPNCHSGDHFVIREQLEHVIRVDIANLEVI